MGSTGAGLWLYGPTQATASAAFFAIDEDQLRDGERNHTFEQVGYVAFAAPFDYTPPGTCQTDFDCDDGDPCNGLDACVGGACIVIPFDCDDGGLDP